MKQLQNHFTTPEQSKRLLELGVPADSADCYYQWETNNSVGYKLYIGEHPAIKNNLFSFREGYTIPCWSVGRLIEIWFLCNQYELKDGDASWFPTTEFLVKDYEVATEECKLDFSKLED